MKIAIDISQINRDGAGISYVMRGLIKGFIPRKDIRVILIVRDLGDFEEVMRRDVIENLPEHIQVKVIPSVPKYLGGGFGWYYKLSRYLRSERVDALVMPTLSSASLFFPRTVQIVNDLSPFDPEFKFGLKSRIVTYLFLLIARFKAKQILTISEATKSDFLKMFRNYSKEIAVIPLGLNEWVRRSVTEEEKQAVKSKLNLPDRFLLSVSTIQPRKNYINMIRAFAKLAEGIPDIHYVIAGGKGWHYQEVFDEVRSLGIEQKIKFLGYLPDEDMPALFDLATGFAYISLAEGFGLPVIEAHAKGLVVATSNLPVFKELKIDYGIYYSDPRNIDEIRDGLAFAALSGKITPTKEFIDYYSWGNCVNTIVTTIN